MERFDGRIAVVTGGGTGMGRELVRQLAAEGCHVSMCDVSADNMAEAQMLASTVILEGVRAGEWRILVGADAHILDSMVRQAPGEAYDDAFVDRLRDGNIFVFTR